MSTQSSTTIPPVPAVALPAKRALIIGAFAVLYLVWGSTFLGIRIAVETIPPLLMAAVRFLISGAILMAFTLRVRPRPTLRQWGYASIVGALFFAGNHGFVSTAARHLPSGLICLIIATEVPIIAVLSSRFLPNQPLTRRSILGAVLGVTGVAGLFASQGLSPNSETLFPLISVFLASLSWSIGAVLSQRLDQPREALLRSGMQMLTGGVLLTLLALARGELTDFRVEQLSARSIGAFFYLIVFGSILAFSCYNWLLRQVRTDLVATHVFVNPLVALSLGAWLGHEVIPPSYLFAGALILGSVWLITVSKKRPDSPDV